MRKTPPERLEAGRIRTGEYGSHAGFGMTGAFHVQGPKGAILKIVASEGDIEPWEHVSVSLPNRTPNWQEMCFVKALFWDHDELVVQYHPRSTDYVNCHPHCLHMWRHKTREFPTPPSWMVGPLNNLKENLS